GTWSIAWAPNEIRYCVTYDSFVPAASSGRRLARIAVDDGSRGYSLPSPCPLRPALCASRMPERSGNQRHRGAALLSCRIDGVSSVFQIVSVGALGQRT